MSEMGLPEYRWATERLIRRMRRAGIACLVAPLLFAQAEQTPAARLHEAARTGNLSEIKRLLSAGIPVNDRDPIGSTPLLDAVLGRRTEAAELLIAAGADVNARNLETGVTAIEYAVTTQNAAVLRALLQAKAQTNVRNRNGSTLLHLAGARGSTAVLELLLEWHADVAALDDLQYTPLDICILNNQLNALPILLAHGADASRVRAADGRQPLHLACVRGFAAVIAPLVAAGASPVAKDRFGQTPLDLALAYKNLNVVAALVKLGSHVAAAQSAADAAMESATLRGQTEIVRMLLEGSYDPARPTPSGSTFLNDAALKGCRKVAQLLLDHGARVDVADGSGELPLHDAAMGGDGPTIGLLLDHGAEVDARDRESGATPLMLAASLGRATAVRVLLARGARPELRDRAGRTALDRARETDSPETVSLLDRHS